MQEAPAGGSAKEHRKDGDEVGGHTNLNPHQGKGETDGARKIHIKPLFGVVGFERCLQQLTKGLIHINNTICLQR